MPRRPSLDVGDVRAILSNAGFEFKRQKGSHQHWEGYVRGQRRVVTVDANCAPFTTKNDITKRMIQQSGLTKDEFYELLNGPINNLPIGRPEVKNPE